MNKGKHTLLIIILVCVGVFVMFMVKMSDYITHMTDTNETALKESEPVKVELSESVPEPQAPVLTTRDEQVGNVRVSIPKSWVSSQENDNALWASDKEEDSSTAMIIQVGAAGKNAFDKLQGMVEDGSIKAGIGDWTGKVLGDYTTEYYEREDLKGYLFRYLCEVDENTTLPCETGVFISEKYKTYILSVVLYQEGVEETALTTFDEFIDSIHIIDVYEESTDSFGTDESGADSGEKDTEGTDSIGNDQDGGGTDDSSNTSTSEDEVDPDLKAFLDSYEEVMNEYVDFMKKYSADPNNVISMMSEYMDMMNKYLEFSEAIKKYDTKTMSKADAQYYIDVTARVNKKLLEIY